MSRRRLNLTVGRRAMPHGIPCPATGAAYWGNTPGMAQGAQSSYNLPGQNTISVVPMMVPRNMKINSISANQSGGTGTSGKARFGVYRNAKGLFKPDTLLCQGAEVDLTSAGDKTTSLVEGTVILNRGLIIWVGVGCGTREGFAAYFHHAIPMDAFGGMTVISDYLNYAFLQSAWTYDAGGLPTTFPGTPAWASIGSYDAFPYIGLGFV